MSPAEIVALYLRREAEAGGLAKVDPKKVAEGVAAELGLPYADVREALMNKWTGGASG
jgi:hypothetical protein